MVNKKRRRNFIIVALVIIILIAGYLIRNSNGHVIVDRVETEEVVVRKTVSASGKVISENEATLSFSSVGRLEGIEVEKGDKLNKGDFIGYISNYDSTKSSEAYKHSVDVAKKDLEIYIENYSTNLSAVGGEDEYNLNVKRLRDLLSKAEASYQSSLGTLGNTYLYAPFEGTIIDVYKEVGEVASIGSNIVKIANLEKLIFEIEVDQEDFGLLSLGQEVEVTLDSYDNHIFSGTVSELPKYANETTEEFVVKIALRSSTEKPVLLGMNGDASIIIESTQEPVKALTFDAVFSEDGNYYVWEKVGDKASKLPVEIGLEGDIYTEIKTDLSNKEIVIPIEEDLEQDTKIKYEE